MATTKKTETTKTEPETVQARVVVTPADGDIVPPNDRADGSGVDTESGAPTQVMDRQEYADRLRAGASPVNDLLLAEQDTTVAITRPNADTSPVPAVVEMSKTEAAKVEPDIVETARNVQVKPAEPKPAPKKK